MTFATLTDIAASDDFFAMPAAFSTIDPSQISAVVVSCVDENSGIQKQFTKNDMLDIDWSDLMAKLLAHAGVENIDEDDHFCATLWCDLDGAWHRTMEGDFLESIID